MGGAFSSSSSSKPANKNAAASISDIDRAVLDLKNARDRLQRYRQKLERDDAVLLQRAAAARDAGQTKKALGILRLKKYKQVQAGTCEDQLLTVLQMVETIDSKQNDSAVLQAMAVGKDTLKKMHEETTVEDVLELMDQVSDGIAVEQEINEILMGVPNLSVDQEEAVEAELLALESMMNPEAAAAAATPAAAAEEVNLPTVPTTKLPEALPAAPTGAISVPEDRVAVPS
jgi:charged multivesicular body protein 6